MHGLIFAELKKYGESKYGKEVWEKWLHLTELAPGRDYSPGQVYPDSEAVSILTAAAKFHAIDMEELLDGFGIFIAPDLIQLLPELVQEKWKTLDLIEHTENIIHKMVRFRIKGAAPPRLEVERQSSTRALINYRSDRQLCHLLKGIVRGIARHYGEEVTITDQTCMLDGDGACQIMIEVVSEQPAP